MNDQLDHNVREIGSTRIELRGDLIFTPQLSGEQPYYMIEDPMNSRFFRLGLEEYSFVSLLDGDTSIREALSQLSTVMPNHRLTDIDTVAICRWLVELNLADSAEAADASRLAATAEALENKKALGRWNPLVFRLPLCRPDRAFETITKWCGWLHSSFAMLAWLILVSIGVYFVCADWTHFVSSSRGIFGPQNWVWLVLCWVVLKIVHETSHGIVCKRYGGTVREMGVLFILFAPLAYVDVTSSWRFRSRWQRIHVAAAGMYSELFIAAIAAIVWANVGSGWLSHLCFNIVIMSSVTTLLFNANPLMKFDGYYILSDLLGIPNLYVNGQQYMQYWARRYLFGIRSDLPAWSGAKGFVTRVYGVTSLLWRVLICISLTLAAATLFHGGGIVLACLAAVLWIGQPAWKLIRYLVYGKPGEQPNRLRFLLTTGIGVGTCAAIMILVPWPAASVAPAIVEYSPLTVVRAGANGFVRKLDVETGQRVKAGQIIAVLQNRELRTELADLELSIEQSKIRSRQLEQQNELAECQAEFENRRSLIKQRTEKLSQVAQLTIHAPCDGTIIYCEPNELIGNYVKTGDEIFSIGDDNDKELRLSIAQSDLDAFAAQLGKPIRVDFTGAAVTQMRLTKIIPRANLTPIHPALTTVNGGPLAVRNVNTSSDSDPAETNELLAPRFTGIVSPTANQSNEHLAGRVGTASFRAYRESIGAHISHSIQSWVRRQLSDEFAGY